MREVGRFVASEVFAERYRIERLLSVGGMGAVYVVQHVRTHERLALKVMKPEIVALPGAATRFEQEARVGALIQSQGVVRVIDAGVDPASEMPFLVMELLRGRDLSELLRERGRVDAPTALRYLTQVARTLDKAHAAGVVHRDLKPENLFVVEATDEEPERIKILDFGIAKLLLAVHDASTQAQGTPLYMAPEQTRRGEIGPAADIWPLGLIVYSMLVGRPYWEAETIAQLYGEILSGDYAAPSLRAARHGVALPPGFDVWFFRCVCVDPTQRFARASEAARTFAEVIGASPPSFSEPSRAEIALAATVPSLVPPPKNDSTFAPFSEAKPKPGRRSLLAPIVVALACAIGLGVYLRTRTNVHPLAPVPSASSSFKATRNPILSGDHPDPHVLRVIENGAPAYYLVATVGNAGDIPVWKSDDLVHFRELPEKLFRKTGGNSLALHDRHYCAIWAPEIVAIDSGFMLHFTAQRFASPQGPCPPYREDSGVYLAWSSSPSGPFARDDHPWEPLAAGAHASCKLRPRLPHAVDLASAECDGIDCSEIVRLDSNVFADQGRWWLSYSWAGRAGTPNAGQHVRTVEVDKDDPFVVRCDEKVAELDLIKANDASTLAKLRDACPRCGEMLAFDKGRDGEDILRMGAPYGIVEAPSLFRRKNMVYALVSHSGWNSAYYSVLWIAAPSVPELASGSPTRIVGRYLIPSRDQSFGHGAPVLGPDGEHWFYVHHHLDHGACTSSGNCSRDVWVSPMEFEDRGDGRGDVWLKPRFPAEE